MLLPPNKIKEQLLIDLRTDASLLIDRWIAGKIEDAIEDGHASITLHRSDGARMLDEFSYQEGPFVRLFDDGEFFNIVANKLKTIGYTMNKEIIKKFLTKSVCIKISWTI